jgi:hypothetical protein
VIFEILACAFNSIMKAATLNFIQLPRGRIPGVLVMISILSHGR